MFIRDGFQGNFQHLWIYILSIENIFMLSFDASEDNTLGEDALTEKE